MQDPDLLTHVQAAAALAGVPLSAERATAVAQHFGRTLAMARLLDTAPLPPELELAEIYCPAPFPETDTPGQTSPASEEPQP